MIKYNKSPWVLRFFPPHTQSVGGPEKSAVEPLINQLESSLPNTHVFRHYFAQSRPCMEGHRRWQMEKKVRLFQLLSLRDRKKTVV